MQLSFFNKLGKKFPEVDYSCFVAWLKFLSVAVLLLAKSEIICSYL